MSQGIEKGFSLSLSFSERVSLYQYQSFFRLNRLSLQNNLNLYVSQYFGLAGQKMTWSLANSKFRILIRKVLIWRLTRLTWHYSSSNDIHSSFSFLLDEDVHSSCYSGASPSPTSSLHFSHPQLYPYSHGTFVQPMTAVWYGKAYRYLLIVLTFLTNKTKRSFPNIYLNNDGIIYIDTLNI